MVEADKPVVSPKRKRPEEVAATTNAEAETDNGLNQDGPTKRQKLSKEEYRNVSTEGKCPFILERKKKPCRKAPWKRLDGSRSTYCVIHAYLDTPNMEYVTCPWEPKNVMPKEHLEHHLKVCPKA